MAAHLNRRKRFEGVFGTHRCRGNTIPVVLLRPSNPGLLPVSSHPLRRFHQEEDSPPTPKLYFGFCETRGTGRDYAPRSQKQSRGRQGKYAASITQACQQCRGHASRFAPDSLTLDSLSASMVAAGGGWDTGGDESAPCGCVSPGGDGRREWRSYTG